MGLKTSSLFASFHSAKGAMQVSGKEKPSEWSYSADDPASHNTGPLVQWWHKCYVGNQPLSGKPNQNLMSEVTSPRRKPTITVLLTDFMVKLRYKYLCLLR